jgi:hypothetical protein
MELALCHPSGAQNFEAAPDGYDVHFVVTDVM